MSPGGDIEARAAGSRPDLPSRCRTPGRVRNGRLRAADGGKRAAQRRAGPTVPEAGTVVGRSRAVADQGQFGPFRAGRRVTPGRGYLTRYKSSYDTDRRGPPDA